MNTAEALVKEAEGILNSEVLVPIVMQKCAERGYVPQTQEELQVVLNVASSIREKIASGELAPVPASALNADGEMSKQASEAIANDPLAYGDDIKVDMNSVDSRIKEAAACAVWGALEQMAAAK